MGQQINISTSDIPSSYCPPDFASAWAFGVAHLIGELPGNLTTFNYGPDTPDPDNQDKPWFKTDVNYLPERWYVYSGGAWVSKHPDFAGKVVMWEGAEADIVTLDGGEAGTVTAVTGPMWEKVSEMDGRFPVGPGTLAGSPVAVGGIGGSHEHVLDLEQVPPHTHPITGRAYTGSGNLSPTKIIIDDDYASTDQTAATGSTGGKTDGVTTTTKAVNHIPPYRAIFFIRKTARGWYRI